MKVIRELKRNRERGQIKSEREIERGEIKAIFPLIGRRGGGIRSLVGNRRQYE